MGNEEIRVKEKQDCYLCGNIGEPLYEKNRDQLFSSSGEWGYRHCRQCRLVWLNPQPIPEDLGKVYKTYYTHEEPQYRQLKKYIKHNVLGRCYGYNSLQKDVKYHHFLGKAVSYLPLIKEIFGMEIMGIPGSWKGKILDIGCGNGRFLSQMKKLGWSVQGVDIDEKAASMARDLYDIDVFVGKLENAYFRAETFDVITMNHVIEHDYNPIQLLKKSWEALKPGGRLVLSTPNIESRGHKKFKKSWRGLEPPRHLILFSMNSLKTCTQQAGFETESIRSSTHGARGIYWVSKLLQSKSQDIGISPEFDFFLRLKGYLFQIKEEVFRVLFEEIGEEIYFVGIKQ